MPQAEDIQVEYTQSSVIAYGTMAQERRRESDRVRFRWREREKAL